MDKSIRGGVRELLHLANKFVKELSKPFVGREEEATAIVLAIVSGEHIVLIGEPGCVSGDTIIASDDGKLFYIEDLAKDLVPGVYVTDFPIFPPGNAKQLHIYDVIETVLIRTKHGFMIRVTPNHPIMTDQGWKEARELKPKDKIVIYRQIPSPKDYVRIPNEIIMPVNNPYRGLGWRKIKERKKVKRPKVLDEKLAELLGIFFAEGFFGHNYIGFGVGINERELQNRILKLMAEIFGVKPQRISERRSKKTRTKNIRIFRYNSVYLNRLFRWLDHDHEGEKRVSRWILISPKSVSAAFLRGLFEGDGCVNISRAHRTYNITLKSKSLKLLQGVQILLLRHGILSKIYTGKHYDKRYGKTYTYHVLRINGLENLLKFKDEIGFISIDKRKKLDETISILSLSRKSGGNTDLSPIIYDPVKEVKLIHEQIRVYDFHVPKTHSFFTNGMLSHNTAKSALARRAADLINARFFKYLLTKFTEPDELFGPLDIRALKEGKYIRITKNKLPEAEIAFIDEIFNANSAILNMFLTIMNERILYDGYNEIKVPLWTMIAATNRIPDEPELQALYDRFLFRHFIKPISEDKWMELLDASWKIEAGLYDRPEPILNMDHIRALNKLLFEVDLSKIKEKLVKLYAIFEDQGIHITDRRKGKALKVIAANALLNERMVATEEDLLVLKVVIPKDRDQAEQVIGILMDEIKAAERHLRELAEIEANIREARQYILCITGFEPRLVDYLRSFETVRDRVRRIADETTDEVVRRKAIDVLNDISDVIALIRRKLGI